MSANIIGQPLNHKRDFIIAPVTGQCSMFSVQLFVFGLRDHFYQES